MALKDLERRLRASAQCLVTEAARAGITCGCAESCTGGLVSGAITAIPGSSEVLLGGIVSYALSVKQRVLGVSSDVLDNPALGAVSAECAGQMCAGAARVLGCDIAVSVTGIAGPGGEEPGKPVGTVWFGLWRHGSITTELRTFAGSRDEVRLQAVEHALTLIREAIVELSQSDGRVTEVATK